MRTHTPVACGRCGKNSPLTALPLALNSFAARHSKWSYHTRQISLKQQTETDDFSCHAFLTKLSYFPPVSNSSLLPQC